MATIPDLPGFARLIIALDPWLDQIVIIGGWAHTLYRLHPRAQKLEFAPLMTLDADIALPRKLPRRAPGIRELLVANGFQEDFRGDDKPPATHYRLKDEAGGFYAEFLTPLVGGDLTRSGKRKATAQVAGVTSQQLRYLELLLQRPWLVELDPGEFRVQERKAVQIANPVSFLAQKLLIYKGRDQADRAKDILYIHDTLQVFGPRLQELRDEWTGHVLPQIHSNTARTVAKASQWLFAEMSDAIREAAMIAVDRRLSPEGVRESCCYGLEQIFT
jgi:hypothetical protein